MNMDALMYLYLLRQRLPYPHLLKSQSQPCQTRLSAFPFKIRRLLFLFLAHPASVRLCRLFYPSLAVMNEYPPYLRKN